MSNRRPYIRSMHKWWLTDAYFVGTMVREVTALFVAAYAVVLLVGLVRLSQGAVAYNGWLEALRSPLSLVFHLVVLATFVYHSWSWFKIMPKTLPILFIGGKRVQQETITRTGLAAAVLCCLAVFVAAWGLAP